MSNVREKGARKGDYGKPVLLKLSWPPKDFTPGGTELGDCGVKWGCLANKSASLR